jgi:hypothetical protein
MHAERDGEFSAMMEIVGDDVPDNPLACERVVLPFVGKLIGLREVGDVPAVERVLDHLPGGLQPSDQLGWLPFDGILGPPGGDLTGELGAPLTPESSHPSKTTRHQPTPHHCSADHTPYPSVEPTG